MNKVKLQIMLKKTEDKLDELNRERLRIKQDLYYLDLYQNGYAKQSIDLYIEEDKQTLIEAIKFKSDFNALKAHFFGYPGNLSDDSPLVRQLRYEEAELFYINNAGDPFENSYGAMDGKIYERKVLELFFKRFDLDPTTSWGYVTSGGSESNVWAIQNGFKIFPNGHLYFCEAAHYSVAKAIGCHQKPLYPFTIIPKKNYLTEAIDIDILIKEIKNNYDKKKINPILLLTWGTTKYGSIDDVKKITDILHELNIDYYLHVDAVFYGGIPINQLDAPICPSLKELSANSLSVSFHKFFGVPNINSIVLSDSKTNGQKISYLGQHDTTVSGSRSFAIFSAYQRLKEVLERSPSDYYRKNIQVFLSLLKRYPIKYYRDGLSNIIIIPKPNLTILNKYQLATFEGKSQKISLAHFILNPFHTAQEITEFIQEIYDDQIHNNLVLDL